MIKAVIFDMDGVIVDSEPIESLAWERLLIKLGKKPIFNSEGLIHQVGLAEEGYNLLMEKYSIEENIEVIKLKKRAIFRKLIMKNTVPMPGFLSLMKILKKQKISVALASNRITEIVHTILDKLEVKNHFKVVLGSSPNRNPKPSPDIYLECSKKLKISPKFCLAIEDSETGVISAKDAVMKVIAVPNKYTKSHDFSKADLVIKSLSDITLKTIQSL